MKMRRLVWGVLVTLLVWPLGSGAEPYPGRKPEKPGREVTVLPDLSLATCPVLGDPVTHAHSAVLERAPVFFSSAEALAEYLRHPSEYAPLARAQLVATGQVQQQVCPLTGAPLRGYHWLTVAGVEVRVANAAVQAAARKRPATELMQKVFDGPAFSRTFALTPIAAQPADLPARLDLLEFAKQIPETPADSDTIAGLESGLKAAFEAVGTQTRQLAPRQGWIGLGVSLLPSGRPVLVAILSSADATAEIPPTLAGFPVVPVVTGEFYAGGTGPRLTKFSTSRTTRLPRPVPIGVSAGSDYANATCTSGTLGCRLVSTDATEAPVYYALGNNHIFAGLNLAPAESPAIQPGLADSGCDSPEENQIGWLARSQLVQFGNLPNRIDAALVRVTPETVGNSTPSGFYGTPRSQHLAPMVGLLTRKVGRSTGQTNGRIALINTSIYVNYGTGSVLFTGQSLVAARSPSTVIAQGGDSGSLMVTDPNNSPVGLLFSTNSSGSVAVCNDLREVFKAFADLKLRIDGVN